MQNVVDSKLRRQGFRSVQDVQDSGFVFVFQVPGLGFVVASGVRNDTEVYKDAEVCVLMYKNE